MSATLENGYRSLALSLGASSLTLTAADLEALIGRLAGFRGAMIPRISEMAPTSENVERIPDPGWAVEPDAVGGRVVLHLRDPRFGWLHYSMADREAATLLGRLASCTTRAASKGAR